MALTDFQRAICRLLADHRISSGESSGGVALNEIMATSRISRDIDLFHDTVEALEASWAARPTAPGSIQAAVNRDQLVFHPGRIGGAWPEIKQR